MADARFQKLLLATLALALAVTTVAGAEVESRTTSKSYSLWAGSRQDGANIKKKVTFELCTVTAPRGALYPECPIDPGTSGNVGVVASVARAGTEATGRGSFIVEVLLVRADGSEEKLGQFKAASAPHGVALKARRIDYEDAEPGDRLAARFKLRGIFKKLAPASRVDLSVTLLR